MTHKSRYLVSFSESSHNSFIPISSQGSHVLALQIEGGCKEPAYFSDEEVAVIFDGELFNSSRVFTKNAPVQIASAFRRTGESVFKQLQGIYFLILWDKRADTLYCVRDRTGIYPFFYSTANSSLRASTSIDYLSKCTDRAVDRLQLAQHLSDRWIDPERTYFKSIKRLPSGSILRFTPSQTERYRYWCPFDESLTVAQPEEYQMFSVLLERAVSRAIGGEDFGVLMSGGIDSVTISAIASQVKREGQKQHALSLKYPHPFIDESRIQQSVSASLCIDLELVDNYSAIAPLTPLEAYLKLSSDWPVPLQNFWFSAYYALACKGAQKGCRSILTGDGGDEYLDDGPVIAADLLKRLDLIGLYRLWRVSSDYHLISKFNATRLLLWKFGIRPLLSHLARQSIYKFAPHLWRNRARAVISESMPAWLLPDKGLRNELIEGCIEYSIRSSELYKKLQSFQNAYLVLFEDNPLTSLYFEQLFEMGERLGLRVRAPLMDPDLTDLLIRTPTSVLHRGGKSKALAREIVQKIFPELRFSEQKKVLLDPIGCELILKWYKENRESNFEHLADLGIVDPVRLRNILTQSDPNRIQLYYLKELLNLQMWLSSQ